MAKVVHGNQSDSRCNWLDRGNQSDSRCNWLDRGNQSDNRCNWLDHGNQSDSRCNWLDHGNQSDSHCNWPDTWLSGILLLGLSYTQIQIWVHTLKLNQIKLQHFQFTVFSVCSRRPGAGIAVLAVCTRFGNRKLHYARLRFEFQPLLAHCFGTFSISSFPFIFFFWKLFQHRFQKNGKYLNFAAEYEPRFELPENSVPVLHKAQHRNTLRQQDLHVIFMPPKTQNWAYPGLENKGTAKYVQKYLWLYINFFPV